MPFGRHKGQLLSQLPDSYISWLRTLDNLRAPLRLEVEREYQCRLHPDDRHAPAAAAALTLAPALHEAAVRIVLAGYRQLVKTHHPDAGGDHTAMVHLTAAKDALERFLRGAA